MRVITINKFLAAMQLIEGYTQAYTDDKQEREDFEKQKNHIISKLTETDEIELVQNGLGFSGVSFRKAVKEYLYKGCNCLEDMSKNAFLQKNKELIDKIVNDRNVYTHSSNRAKPQLSFNEMINVAVVCKQIYRILLLNEMGIPHSLLIQRIAYSLQIWRYLKGFWELIYLLEIIFPNLIVQCGILWIVNNCAKTTILNLSDTV